MGEADAALLELQKSMDGLLVHRKKIYNHLVSTAAKQRSLESDIVELEADLKCVIYELGPLHFFPL